MSSRRGYNRSRVVSRITQNGVASKHRPAAADTTDTIAAEHFTHTKQQELMCRRPPTGVRGLKAWRIVKPDLLKHGQADGTYATIGSSTLESVTGLFAKPLQPVPGEEPVQDSWNNIIDAPVSMQVEQILGNRFKDSISSGYGSQDLHKQAPHLKTSQHQSIGCSIASSRSLPKIASSQESSQINKFFATSLKNVSEMNNSLKQEVKGSSSDIENNVSFSTDSLDDIETVDEDESLSDKIKSLSMSSESNVSRSQKTELEHRFDDSESSNRSSNNELLNGCIDITAKYVSNANKYSGFMLYDAVFGSDIIGDSDVDYGLDITEETPSESLTNTNGIDRFYLKSLSSVDTKSLKEFPPLSK